MKAATYFWIVRPSVLRFQSAPPVKAATPFARCRKSDSAVSIRAAREGGDDTFQGDEDTGKVSIRAAREGGDCGERFDLLCRFCFNPRRP